MPEATSFHVYKEDLSEWVNPAINNSSFSEWGNGGGDDDVEKFSFGGKTFTLGENTYTHIFLQTNGWLQLTDADASGNDEHVPSLSGFLEKPSIAIPWDDYKNGTIYYTPDCIDDQFIIVYETRHYGDPDALVKVTITLNMDSHPSKAGNIEIDIGEFGAPSSDSSLMGVSYGDQSTSTTVSTIDFTDFTNGTEFAYPSIPVDLLEKELANALTLKKISFERAPRPVDTTAPVITVTGDNPATVKVGATYTDAGATASDNVDGDLTSDIVITGSVDTSLVGTYTLTYSATDAAGNTGTATRTVNVIVYAPSSAENLQGALTKWYTIANGTDSESYGSPLEYANNYTGTGNNDDYFGNPNTWDVTGPEGNRITSMDGLFFGISNINTYSVHPEIGNWDVSNVTSMGSMFRNSSFNKNIGSWNTSNNGYMFGMFQNNSEFNQDISGWDVSSVNNMGEMFTNASKFNKNISGWDVSSVTAMEKMFEGATAFNQPIGNWTTTGVTQMWNMFQGATSFNQDISNWDVSSVENMGAMFMNASKFNNGGQPIDWTTTVLEQTQYMFSGATLFNQPITWSTNNVNNMSYMFQNAEAFDQNIGYWITDNVANMQGMFSGAILFNQSINAWKTGNVSNMYNMFYNAFSFDQNIASWDVSNVDSMEGMFAGALVFNNGGSNTINNNWNTGSVKTMKVMFQNANAFNQPIEKWNVSVVEDMSHMFSGATNFKQNISVWDTSLVGSDKYDSMFLNSGITDKLNGFTVPTPLSTEFNKDIGINGYNPVSIKLGSTYTDAGAVAASDVTNLTTTNEVNTSVLGTYSVIYSGTKGDQTVTVTATRTVNVIYYTPSSKEDLQAALNKWYEKANDSNDSNAVDTANTYSGTGDGSDYFGNPNTWDVSGVTDMSWLFYNKTQSNHPDITTWDVSSVTNMTNMFAIEESVNLGFTGSFGNAYVDDGGYQTFPTNADDWAGFANIIPISTPVSFPNSRIITFNATTGPDVTSATIQFQFQYQPHPYVEPYYNTAEITITPDQTSYSFIVGPDQVGSNTFSSFILYIKERDTPVKVENVVIHPTNTPSVALLNQNINIWKVEQSTDLTNMFINSGITDGEHGFSVPTPTYDEFNQDIGITGYNPVTIERGNTNTYTDDGAVAASDVTNLTTTTNDVDTSVAGTYSVIYSGTKGDKTVTATRTVKVVDTTAPIITANLRSIINNGQTSLGSVSANEPVTWSTNNPDIQIDGQGNVTLKQPANYQTKQSYTYTIIATDGSNNTNSVEKTVNVVDTIPPVITINGDNPVTVEKGSTYTDAGATASDNVDGDLTSDIVITGTVNTSVVGTYTINYSATDAAGNTGTATRTVNVEDTTAPIITANLRSTINNGQTSLGSVSANEPVTWSTNNQDIQIDGQGNVSLQQPANYKEKTFYSFTITATDPSNNTKTTNGNVSVYEVFTPETKDELITALNKWYEIANNN